MPIIPSNTLCRKCTSEFCFENVIIGWKEVELISAALLVTCKLFFLARGNLQQGKKAKSSCVLTSPVLIFVKYHIHVSSHPMYKVTFAPMENASLLSLKIMAWMEVLQRAKSSGILC